MTWRQQLHEALEECLKEGGTLGSFQSEAKRAFERYFEIHPTEEEISGFRNKTKSFFKELWHSFGVEEENYEWVEDLLCDVFYMKAKRCGNYHIKDLIEKAELTTGRNQKELAEELDGFLLQVIHWGYYLVRDVVSFPEIKNNIKSKINVVISYIKAW